MEILQFIFRVLWGSIGELNVLRVVKFIGFNGRILENVYEWRERLKLEQEVERKGLLFQFFVEERIKLNFQVIKVVVLYRDLMNFYCEVLFFLF